MKTRLLKKAAAVFAILGSISTFYQPSQAQQITTQQRVRFYCGQYQGEPATLADHPERGIVPLIVWRTDHFSSSGYPPQRRCRIVSTKFQQNLETGQLMHIVSGIAENKLPVLCASKQKHSEMVRCNKSHVLMTLRPEDNSQAFIRIIHAQNTSAQSQAIFYHNGGLWKNEGLIGIDVYNWLNEVEVTDAENNTSIPERGRNQNIEPPLAPPQLDVETDENCSMRLFGCP